MSKKVVLIVDEDSQRTKRLTFMVRLGGYEVRNFDCEAEALNWASYACLEKEVLSLLFNRPGTFDRVEQIAATWIATGRSVPVVLVQKGPFNLDNVPLIEKDDLFFVCEPEGVMQTLDILSAVECGASGFYRPRRNHLSEGWGFEDAKYLWRSRTERAVLAR